MMVFALAHEFARTANTRRLPRAFADVGIRVRLPSNAFNAVERQFAAVRKRNDTDQPCIDFQ
jgi:hypothetical protein